MYTHAGFPRPASNPAHLHLKLLNVYPLRGIRIDASGNGNRGGRHTSDYSDRRLGLRASKSGPPFRSVRNEGSVSARLRNKCAIIMPARTPFPLWEARTGSTNLSKCLCSLAWRNYCSACAQLRNKSAVIWPARLLFHSLDARTGTTIVSMRGELEF